MNSTIRRIFSPRVSVSADLQSHKMWRYVPWWTVKLSAYNILCNFVLGKIIIALYNSGFGNSLLPESDRLGPWFKSRPSHWHDFLSQNTYHWISQIKLKQPLYRRYFTPQEIFLANSVRNRVDSMVIERQDGMEIGRSVEQCLNQLRHRVQSHRFPQAYPTS